jgi:hypothetical protein
MTYYFSDAKISKAAISKQSEIEEDFQILCGNTEFRRSLESTTKSLEATVQRFAEWGRALHQRLNLPVTIPSLQNKTIILVQL